LRFATVTLIGSGWLLSSNKILPMLGTLGQVGNLRPIGNRPFRTRLYAEAGRLPSAPHPRAEAQ